MGVRTEAQLVKRRAQYRAWYAANKENRREYGRAWEAANKQHREDYQHAYNTSERGRERQREWAVKHPVKVLANVNKRKANKIQRTPAWADLKKIEAIYGEAAIMTAMMGEPWHVDHVIPLQGKLVSGLHVHTNLQLLRGAENIRKRNNFEVA